MQKTFICIVLILGLFSCKQLKSDEDIKLTIQGHSGHFLLAIKNFKWSYGMTEINKFNGDFATLDKMVYDSLKGRYGDCRLSIINATKNKYGSVDSTKVNFGVLQLAELNKYQTWEYWHTDGGIAKMLHNYYNAPKPDSAQMTTAKVDTVPSNQISDNTLIPNKPSSGNVNSTVYKFGLDDFYPTIKPDTDPANRYIVDGTIGEVDFEHGQLQVTTIDNESVIIEFYIADVSPNVFERMVRSFKTGNTIKCVVYKTEKPEYHFLAAKVTTQN
jgi:hypothetical protein